MKKMKIFNWDKPKTLYRYIKAGDLFCYQISEKLFGYGRVIVRNKWGAMVEVFDYFTSKPVEGFSYTDVNTYPVLFKCILDCVTLFQAKLESDWRIIAQDPNYIDPNPNEITIVNAMDGIAYNGDYTYSENIGQEEALKRVRQNKELDDTPFGHYHILNLLIKYKPEIFCTENAPFVGFDDFIREEFKLIHNQDLYL